MLVLAACGQPAPAIRAESPTAGPPLASAQPPPPAPTPFPNGPVPDGEFDAEGAAAAFSNVDFSECGKPTGPIGKGHFTVVFEPDGSVSSAVLDGGPYREGTPIGDCLIRKLREVRIRPFAGPPHVRFGTSPEPE
jgi:hypothetical protein